MDGDCDWTRRRQETRDTVVDMKEECSSREGGKAVISYGGTAVTASLYAMAHNLTNTVTVVVVRPNASPDDRDC